MHLIDRFSRHKFVALTARLRPDEQVGRGVGFEGLHKYLVLPPLHFEVRAAHGNFLHRLVELEDAQMVLGCGQPCDLHPVCFLRLDLLAENGKHCERSDD